MSQGDAGEDDAGDVKDTDAIEPGSEPAGRRQQKVPGGAVAILTVVEQALEVALTAVRSQSLQAHQRRAHVRVDGTARYFQNPSFSSGWTKLAPKVRLGLV